MPFTVKSNGQFVEQLKRMRQSSSENKVAFKLRVPDELIWWVWLEYGTGLRGDNPTEGYEINPVNGKYLYFYNTKTSMNEIRESVFMPGIPAFHMITSIQDEINEKHREFVRNKLQESNYDFSELKNAVELELMPIIKEMVVESFHQNLPNHIRETGRLDKTAADTFEEFVEIVPTEEDE